MDATKNRTSVGKLRTSDPETLSVLTQDVLRLPLGQIERGTLADLMALTEVTDQVSVELGKDLKKFGDQMLREISDLPDGPPLAEFLEELAQVDPERVPETVRQAVLGLRDERSFEGLDELFATIDQNWGDNEPVEITLPASGPDIDDSKQTGAGKPRKQVVKAKKKTRRRTTVVDERREEWIREDVLSRLGNYGARGLKESIIVAGSRHRAPWDDLTESEVLATLRKMKRESRVRYSAGRWMTGG